VVLEVSVEVINPAAVEGPRRDTFHVTTARHGAVMLASLERALTAFSRRPGAVLVAAEEAAEDDALGGATPGAWPTEWRWQRVHVPRASRQSDELSPRTGDKSGKHWVIGSNHMGSSLREPGGTAAQARLELGRAWRRRRPCRARAAGCGLEPGPWVAAEQEVGFSLHHGRRGRAAA